MNNFLEKKKTQNQSSTLEFQLFKHSGEKEISHFWDSLGKGLKLKKLMVGETSRILLYKPINNNIVTNNNRKSLWLSQKEKGDLSDYGMFQFLSALPPRVKGFFFVKFSFKKATKFRSLRHFIQWCQQTIKLPDLIYQNALTKNSGFGFLPYLGSVGGGGDGVGGADKKIVTSPCDGMKMQDFAKMQAKSDKNVMAISFSLIIVIN